MLTPGRKPQFGDQFDGIKKGAEKIGDYFKDGKERREDRRKDRERAEKMRTSREEAKTKSVQKRAELQASVNAPNVRWKKVQAGELKERAKVEVGLSSVRFKDASEYMDNTNFKVTQPRFEEAPVVNNAKSVNLNDALKKGPSPRRQALEFTVKGKLTQELDNETYLQLSKLDDQVSIWFEQQDSGLVYGAQMEDEKYPRFYSSKEMMLNDIKDKLRLDQNTLPLLEQLDV